MDIQIEGRIWVAAHGFAVCDAGENQTEWSNQDRFIEDLAGIAPGRVEPRSCARAAGLIPVVLEILDGPPGDDDIEDYDGVVDAPLRLASGALRVDGDADTRFGAVLPPGDYRVRIAYGNGDTCRYDYADGADHVRVSLWAVPEAPLEVRKALGADDDPVREYRGRRSEAELLAWLDGPSVSRRCLAVVALARQGKVELLAQRLEGTSSDAVRRVYLASLGFGGEAALEILEGDWARDPDERLRMVQTLRLVGGERARRIGGELADVGEDVPADVADMIRDAAEEIPE